MNPPSELRGERWICWREEERDGKPTKVPVHPGPERDLADTTDPDTWASFDAAEEYHAEAATDTDGVGVVFRDDDLIMGVDLDDCRDPETGEPSDKAADIIDRLDSLTTVSTSGTGFHVYLKSVIPTDADRQRHDGVEMYDSARFFVWTGERVDGTPETLQTRPSAVSEVHADYVARDDSDGGDGTAPEPSGDVDLDDTELIEKAKSAADGGKFKRLWNGDTSGYVSHSEADLALCSKLAFWTGGDRQRIDRLFRQSGLCRDKWTDRNDYRDRTIDRALNDLTDTYDPGDADAAAAATDGGTAAAAGSTDTAAPEEPTVDAAELSPRTVIAEAGHDPADTDLADLNNSEVAYTLAELVADRETEHYRVAADNAELYAYDGGVWVPGGEEVLRETCYRALCERNSNRLHGEVVHALKSHPDLKIGRDDLGAPEGTVAVANGLLDLRDRSLRDLRPEDYALNQVPTEYDPDAEYEGTEWVEFVEESVREGDHDKLQEYAGYLLWHHAQPHGKAMFLIGPTDSGKGTFLSVIESVIGEENTASQSLYELMQTRWGMAELYGNMANIRNEISASGLGNVERFKELTGGGDLVSAERKGQDPFKFRAIQKFMFATNQVPSVEHAGEPFFNRLLFAKFPDTVPEAEQDRELAERLKQQAPAILNWMLDGLDRLRDQGRFSGECDVDTKREVADAFGSLTDRFAHNLIEATGDPEDIVHKSELYDLMNQYADHLGKGDVPPQQTFTRELKAKSGIGDSQSARVGGDDDLPRVFTGVRVDVEAVEAIGADVPDHATAEEAEADDTGSSQSSL